MILTPNSRWIQGFTYLSLPQDKGRYLALFLRPEDRKSEPVCLLYGGPDSPIPFWLPGLLAAGVVTVWGWRSVGAAYNRLLKGRYDYQRVEGREAVKELKRMMEGGQA